MEVSHFVAHHSPSRLDYSPVNNVRAVKYPSCLLTGGFHDPRVQYWEPAKFAAALRHSQAPESGPVCLKIDLSAGHFSASDRYKYLQELSFDYAFLLDQIGLATGSSIAVRSEGTKPFWLLVTLQFATSVHKEIFLKDFSEVATYVRDHEPSTLMYEALQSDKDPLQLLILEMYTNKETAYLEVHRNSKPFVDFRPKLQALQESGHVVISGHSYLNEDVGNGTMGRLLSGFSL
jgi:quinol monooxygenase YgiN